MGAVRQRRWCLNCWPMQWSWARSSPEAQAALDANEGMKYHTPTAEWLHGMIRPMFDEQFPDDETYDAAFDSTEVMLGIVAADLSNKQSEGEVRATNPPSAQLVRTISMAVT